MKKYTTYRNIDDSYTTYEEEVTAGPDLLPFLFGVIAVYILLPFSPILFFVTKSMIKKHSKHPKIKWLKIANKVTLVVFIMQIVVWIAVLALLIIHLSNIVQIPLLAEIFD